MHCPRCGQPQAVNEIKFCSRCGFPLGLVSELLAHGGFLPQLADLHQNRKLLTRRNGISFSVIWMMFFILLLTPLLGIMGSGDFAGVAAIIGFCGGLIMLIATLMMLKKEPDASFYTVPAMPNQLPNQNFQPLNNAANQQLPPSSFEPVESYTPPAGGWRAPNTDDLVKRGSVTDQTTKLLQKDE